MSGNRSQWSNPFLFILATAGAAIGLGNIWRFPYLAGVNGGGAFVLIYLLCILFIGLPLFLAELYIGQSSQSNTVKAFETLHKKGTDWKFVGYLAVLTAFLIMAFYSVVGGWVLDYGFQAMTNQFCHCADKDFGLKLEALFKSPYRLVFWHFVFVSIVAGIVIGGIQKGLERCNKYLMPALFIILLALFVKATMLPGFEKSLVFLFYPDFSKIKAMAVLEAVGQAFFSLGLAMGIVITFGSYFKKEEKLTNVAFMVSFLDTLIAVVAGIVIFSVVFSYGVKPDSGPTLIFQTLPMLFAKMPGGYIIAVAFFLLVAFAAITSAISLTEVVITFWVETFSMGRRRSTLLVCGVIFILGIFCALSFNVLANIKILNLSIFDFLDKITSSIFLPLGGILTAVFYGWILKPEVFSRTIDRQGKHPVLCIVFAWLVRILVPLAILIMLVKGLIGW